MAKFSPKTLAFIVRTIVAIVLLASAAWLMNFLIATKPTVSTSGFESQSVRVQVLQAQPMEVARQWRGYGTTQAKDTADVPARVSATVLELPGAIEVGMVVKKGQVLARLDPTDFSNALDAAEKRIVEADAGIDALAVESQRLTERLALEEKTVELADEEFKKQVERYRAGSASAQDVNRVQRVLIAAEGAALATQQQIDLIPTRRAGLQAQRAAAKADRDTAKANLQRTEITSPIDGVVQSLDIEVGENLAPGARVARVVDPRVIEVPLRLPASARSYVTRGNTVTLTTRSQPDDCPPWQAKVTRIGVVDEPTRTFTVFAEVDQSHVPLRNFAEGGGPYKLPAGAFTLARLDTAEPQTRIILPARAIQEGRIRTVVDGQVVGKSVQVAFDLEGDYASLGLNDRQWVVLKDSLEPGELIVLSASMTILDGQRVEPVVSNDRPIEPDQTVRNGGLPEGTDEGSP